MELNPIAKELNIAYQPHPVAPLAGRTGMVAVIDGTTSVRDVLLMAGIDPHQPITIQLDGEMLTVEEWDLICPTEGQLLSVHATVQGGGGGSNVLQVIAMIAVVVIAASLTVATGGTFGVVIAGSLTVGMVAGAVVSVAGSLIIGALFAPKPPAMPNAPAAVSPTYSLSGGQNRARPYEPMPFVMGTHRLFLDYAARPYTEYRGNDQYLYQIFNLSLGNITASDYKIGTTPIESYSDYEFVTPDANGRLLAFPGNVDSSAGAVLTKAGGAVSRNTSVDTEQIGIDLEASLFFAADNGNLENRSAEILIEIRNLASGGFFFPALSVYGDNANYNLSTGVLTITGNSQRPIRLTLLTRVTVSQYEVKLTRLTDDSNSSRDQTQTNWSVLRSYQLDNTDYKGQNRVGLIIKATEQLNGALQTLSANVVAQATYWNGTAWVTGVTSNPAHWFMHFSRGVYNSDNKLMYGIGLTDSQIDLASLNVWANFCATEGLTFNAVIDSTLTAADVLTMLGTVGLGSPSWASGKLGVIFDSRNASPVMAFGMSNIIRDSFEVAYISENLAEEIVVRFSNVDKDYEQEEVRVLAPDVVTPSRTSAIDLFGCTNATMAGKFANYIAAQQYYRRRRVTWQSDFEGFVCQRGDVVLLSHDLTQWGYSGRFVSVDGNVVTLDRSVPRQDQIEYLMLIRPDGSTTTYDVQATTDEESDTLTIVNDFVTFQSGANLIDHRWTFSPLETPGKKLKILSVQPASDARLQIVATDEVEAFYDAWDGTFVAPPTETILPAIAVAVNNLTISNRVAFVNGYLTNRVAIAWGVSGSVLYSRVNIYLDGNLIQQIPEALVPFAELDIGGGGSVFVEVTPYGLIGAGLTETTTLSLSALDFPAPPTTVTLVSGEGDKAATFEWTPVLGVQSYVIEVVVGGGVKRSVNVGNTLSYTYTLETAQADAGPFRAYTFRVYSVNQTGQSTTFTSAEFNNPQIGQLQNASIDPMPNSLWFAADRPTDADYAGIIIWISKTAGFTPTNVEIIYKGEVTDVTLSAYTDGEPLETGVIYYVRAAAYDTFGEDNLTLTGELVATILSPAWGLVQGDIDESVLSAGLNNRIDLIDAPASVIGSLANVQAQLQGQIDDLNSYPEYDNTVTYSEGEIVKYENAIYQATQTTTGNLPTNTTFWTKIGDYSSLGDAVAAHTNQIEVLTTNDINQATQITNLFSATNTNAAAITAETTARTNADSALASSITTLQSAVNNNSSAIATEQTVRSDADTALASSITTLQSTVNTNISAIQNEATVRANADSALASQITTVQSTVGSNTTSIQTNATSIDGINGKYTVKIDNNGYVSGYGLISTTNNATPFSEFIVVADRFALAPVATNPDAVDGSPFFVLTAPQVIDGTTIPAGTYMKKAFIHDATITTAKIENLAVVDAKIASLNATKINAGFISADRIAAGSINADKIDTRNLTVKDGAGNILFGSGTPLVWDNTNIGLGLNILRNGGFEDGLAGWYPAFHTTPVAPVIGWNLSSDYNLSGSGLAYSYVNSNVSAGQVFDINSPDIIPIEPNVRYEAQALLNTHRCQGNVIIIWLDQSKNYITESGGNLVNFESGVYTLNDLRLSSVFATSPNNSRFAFIVIRGRVVSNTNEPDVFVKNVFFGMAGLNQTTPSKWTPGRGLNFISASNASTYIANAAIDNAKILNLDATKITTGLLDADRIGVGTIDAKIATITNAQISTLDAGKINTGTLSADRIDAGSIDAKLLNVDGAVIINGTISNAKIEDATIQTAKIGVAQIDTLRVAGNAVTTQASFSRSNAGTGSFVINSTTGGQLLIIGNVFEASIANASLTISGVGVVQGTDVIIDDAGTLGTSSATSMFLVNIGAGSTTISASSNRSGFVMTGLLTQR